ncbi:hypothetical protein Ddye_009174 [Dipteronia dyeriana]|uniref:RNase H type-1 domain-containing protein n=1 Tax=Dipteronia dyeriana TaxID=168575 RepID=A0AAD9XB90_9ROSI|nr:hypothetical protein Ddye_009174 [Dipteronia dyeriana]
MGVVQALYQQRPLQSDPSPKGRRCIGALPPTIIKLYVPCALKMRVYHKNFQQEDVLSWAIEYGKEYMGANEPEGRREGSKIRKIEKWVPPPPGGFKVNTDAALDAQEGCIGVGIIIRNEVGDVMASSAQKVLGGFSVPVAEVVAILKGMQFAFIHDILRLLDGPLNFSVTFASRTANSAAHGLVKLGLKVVNNLYLVEECPPCLDSTVMGDRPQFSSP